MKKYIIPATLLAMISVASVSCQKENLVEPAFSSVETSATRTIRYFVNGKAHRSVIHNDEEWNALLSTLFALAREGYSIRLFDENNTYCEACAKATVTFTTTNKQEAIEWVKTKTLEGYDVTMSFNQETGEYTCIAVK
ncbi:MAG: hypothetical protein IJL48_04055 [Bacteroidales bacterium]|nr:hypothetical protein [Bacteroidales bacterium]